MSLAPIIQGDDTVIWGSNGVFGEGIIVEDGQKDPIVQEATIPANEGYTAAHILLNDGAEFQFTMVCKTGVALPDTGDVITVMGERCVCIKAVPKKARKKEMIALVTAKRFAGIDYPAAPASSGEPASSESPSEPLSESPSESASESPSQPPSESPSESPSQSPSESASESPSQSPSESASESPSEPQTSEPVYWTVTAIAPCDPPVGSGYQENDVLSYGSPLGDCTFIVTSVDGGGAITGVSLINGGIFEADDSGQHAVGGGSGTGGEVIYTFSQL